MQDNAETNPENITTLHTDPRNVVANVANQESLGLVTSGLAPATPVTSDAPWVWAFAAAAPLVPGEFSDHPVFGEGKPPVTDGPTRDPDEDPGEWELPPL